MNSFSHSMTTTGDTNQVLKPPQYETDWIRTFCISTLPLGSFNSKTSHLWFCLCVCGLALENLIEFVLIFPKGVPRIGMHYRAYLQFCLSYYKDENWDDFCLREAKLFQVILLVGLNVTFLRITKNKQKCRFIQCALLNGTIVSETSLDARCTRRKNRHSAVRRLECGFREENNGMGRAN